LTDQEQERESLFEAIVAMDERVAAMNALQAGIVVRIARLDDDAIWRTDGAASMAQWLVARFGISHQTAAEWVRVGHALGDLPHIRSAFDGGTLSWDQVRAVTRYADAESDRELARSAPGTPVTELRRRIRRPSAPDTKIAHRDRYVHFWFDENEPVLHLRGRLPDAQGVVVARALDLLAHDQLPDPHHREEDYGVYEHYEARCADALTRMASQALGGEQDADRATVVIHVEAAALAGGRAQGDVDDGPTLLPDSVLRFACDARIQAAVDNEEGRVVGIGRVSRSIPPWLSRQIKRRDSGCRFPGCERTRWVHRHHLVHWAQGGPTDLDNLVTLCGFHHRLVHEDGWTISGDPNATIAWIRPDGEMFDPKPPRVSYSRDRVLASKAGWWLPDRVRGLTLDDTS
jgi:hypothetical protein